MKTIEQIRTERNAERAVFVAEFQASDQFEHLRRTHWSLDWQTVGQIAELIRDSWCNRIEVAGRRMWFDVLSKADQYLVVKSLVADKSKWDHCLGADDGREVRVYKGI